MNATKQEKLTYFLKTSQPSNFEEKKMALNLFEFLEQFIIDNFFIILTQFWKTGSIHTILFRSEIWYLHSTFETRSQSRFSWLYTSAIR